MASGCETLALDLRTAFIMETVIRVYGTDWCRLTFGVREYLMRSRVEYDYFDIDRDPIANEFVRAMNDGRQRYPMVVIADETVTNPTLAELRTLLARNRVEGRPGAARSTQRIDDRGENRPG
jgi:mycoredoxin